MNKILTLALGSLFVWNSAQAQTEHHLPANRTCGTGILPNEYENWLQPRLEQMKAERAAGRSSAVVYTIPVVVHVVHNGTNVGVGDNISDAQILSQIAVLNEDFRRLNADTNNTPGVFKPVAADTEIQFCLAQRTPTGQATNGIDRINRNTKGWTAPPYSQTYVNSTIKPQSIWNPNQYLNIWVCNLSNFILGFATFPANSTLTGLTSPFGTATTDGVVILFDAFGRVGNVGAPYNKGRTATHEIGHWLGLRHIWGDATCGNDFCGDTPTQNTANSTCPTFPYISGCGNGPNGDQFMNYMDYCFDNCLNMFSSDQKDRMVISMQNSPFRVNLTASQACVPVGIGENVSDFPLNIFPNPASDFIRIEIPFHLQSSDLLFRVSNMLGMEVIRTKTNKGGQEGLQLDVSSLSNGFYFLEVSTSEGRSIRKFQVNR